MTAEQLRAARSLIRLEQTELAARAEVSLATIKRFEAMDGPIQGRTKTVEALRRVFEEAGIKFIPENGGGAGVRLATPRAAERCK